jgi:YD repeat-containing protein
MKDGAGSRPLHLVNSVSFSHWIYNNYSAYIDDYREASSVLYTYDQGTNGIGRRSSMSDLSGSTSWSYDVRGRTTQESKTITGSGTYVTQWAYNTADRMTSMTYPGGEQVNFVYFHQGALNSVVGTSTYAQLTRYDVAGRMVSRTLGSGGGSLTQSWTYYTWSETALVDGNQVGQGARLKQMTSSASLQDFTYTYDAVGNVRTIVDGASPSETMNYSYDVLNRLKGVSGGFSESYDYDENSGQLISKNTTTLYYQNPNHKHAVSSMAGGSSYSYDSNGNMILRDPAGSTYYNFAYNAENHLVGVSGSTTASFVFDGDGNRVKATVGANTTVFVGNYYEVSGGVVSKYYYQGGQRVAMAKGSDTFLLLLDLKW